MASWSLIVLLSTELSRTWWRRQYLQMYLQDLITCNKITIIQKLEVLFLINIRHIWIRFWSLQFQAGWIVYQICQIIAYNAEIQCVRQRFDNKKVIAISWVWIWDLPKFKSFWWLVTISNFFDVPNIQKPRV